MEQTTIAALATPPGRGGLAVIRISGPRAEEALGQVFRPASPGSPFDERTLVYGWAVDGQRVIDECMAVMMRAPRSYTREDVAEIQFHGGAQVAGELLDALFALGVAPAEPGEFTKRAFLNGRVDLSQAEAVMRLVSATGRRAKDAALRQLKGGALRFAQEAQRDLLRLMSGVTAAIDYPEEISEEEAVGDAAPALEALAGRLESACDERGARILEEGFHAVICGKPNVGKSSLLNALMMEDRAIVTELPGTTRDLVTGAIELGGVRFQLKDTAGIRESGDAVEKIGVRRALDAMQGADCRLMMLDASRPVDAEDLAALDALGGRPALFLLNKADLPRDPGFASWLDTQAYFCAKAGISLSTRTGKGLDALRSALMEQAGEPGDGALSGARHMRLAREAAGNLLSAARALRGGLPLDLCAVDLNAALAALGGITGDNVSEALLDEVFSSFCVGK